MIRKCGVSSLWILIFTSSLYGQSNYDEYLNLSYGYFTTSNLKASNTSVSQFETGISGGYGFLLNEREDELSFGGDYQFFQLKNELEEQIPLGIHSTALSIDYLKHWKNPKWGSTISGGIALISDYRTDSYSAYQTNLNALFHYGNSSDLIWTFGLMYSSQPFGPWFFPILGVDWKINDRLFFETFLFSNLYLEYQLKNNKLYTGLDIEANGQSFVLSSYQGEIDSYITSFATSFPYYPFDNTVFLDYYFNNGFVLFAKAGVRISQEYVHYSENHFPVETSLYNSAIDPSFMAKVGIAYRVRKF